MPYYTLSPTYSVCRKHGYINGEKYTCPICGEATEVYSRITGYYRPVQNWNAGKTEEFKERKLYDVMNPKYQPKNKKSVDTAEKSCDSAEKSCDSAEKTSAPKLARYTLFTTATCPKCKAIKAIFDKGGVIYDTVDCYASTDLVSAYGVTNAPTLVVPVGEGYEIYRGEGEIRKFYDENLRRS